MCLYLMLAVMVTSHLKIVAAQLAERCRYCNPLLPLGIWRMDG
jgi:hypothetical protein